MKKDTKRQKDAVTDNRTIQEVKADIKKLHKEAKELLSKLEAEENIGLRELNDIIEDNPNDIEALQKRARFKADNDDLHGAIEDFMRILELRPCDYIALANIGIFRRELKEYEEGLAYFNKAVLLCPKSSIAFESRAYLRYYLNDYRGTIEDYTQAFENDKNNLISINNRGLTKIEINDFNGAIDDFTLLINSGDESWIGDSYKTRGELKIRMGLIEEGNADLIKAKEIGYSEYLDEYLRWIFEKQN